jgi:hypothetical protein
MHSDAGTTGLEPSKGRRLAVALFWCKKLDGVQVQASHITTYHLRFVDVPKTYKLDKGAGEPTLIDLAKEDGRVVVTAVR